MAKKRAKASRRANGEGSITLRKDGYWEGRVTIEGKRVSVYAKTKEECCRKMAEKIRECNPRKYEKELLRPETTVGDWFPEWLMIFKKKKLRASTYARYELDINEHIIPAIGDIRLCELTTMDVQGLYNAELERGAAPKSVKNLHGVVTGGLGKAAKLKMVACNVAEDCELPPVDKKEMLCLSDEQAARFWNGCTDSESGDLLRFLMLTGMRQSEGIGFTWDEIDLATGKITLSHQYVRGQHAGEGYRFTGLKNHCARSFKVPGTVVDFLRRVQEQQNTSKHSDRKWSNPDPFVFTKKDGTPFSRTTVYKDCKKVAKIIGVPRLRVHDLRHTFATLSLQHGMQIKTLSHILGHATVAFTMDLYGHVTDRMLDEASDYIGEIMEVFMK